ncbi:dihydrofolate reductase family protein [Lysinibacillus sp. KU-BSD001]|uniref:dihydrofolate reductase family protein n=1 Tax=Lysinibacillus sp. KU-BSD001 TaxID=3141328 RepID=UPI0036EE5EB2
MRKFKMFIAQSLDGYIATKEEALQWLMEVEGEGDNGYGSFYETIDTVVMGRKTYDWVMAEMNGEYPYPNKPGYVFTSQHHLPSEDVTFTNEDINAFVERLKSQEGKDIWIVGGGQLIAKFLEAHAIDEMIVTVAPVLLGEGIPLFPEGNYTSIWQLTGSKVYNQFIELHYVKK